MKIEAEEVFQSFQGRNWMGALEERNQFVRKYAWAVPNMAAINEIARHGKVVEIGAGTGYWAYLLRQKLVSVVAYDKSPYENGWCNNYWTEIEVGGPEEAGKHPDRTLLLCWPPYESPMAHEALRAHMDAGGQKLVYVGEGFGGCTGDYPFHELIDESFKLETTVYIPRWYGLNDTLSVYTRIR